MILFCNSWPKSGTHLLLEMASIILGDKGKWYDQNAVKTTYEGMESELHNVIEDRIGMHNDNFAMKGHLAYNQENLKFLKSHNIRTLFIIRDPRDIVFSTVRWVTDLRPNFTAHKYFNSISESERMKHAILGMPDIDPFTKINPYIKWHEPISTRYSLLTGWAYEPSCCFLKFEELSGNWGNKAQGEAIEKVISFLNISEEKIIYDLKNKLINKNSKTYRSGKSGTWEKVFSNSDIENFIECGGEKLIDEFGYKPTLEVTQI